MFQTKITEILNIKYPVIGGTMMWITRPEFTASISNAGGLGVLASAIYQSREAFSGAVDRLFSLTDKPFAININLFPVRRPLDNEAYIDILIESGAKIVETSGHSLPENLCKRIKEAGLIWMHKCVGVRYALKALKMGADIITVVGYENGGATGKLDIGAMALIPRVVDSVKVPVIGGGGVSDGRGFLATLALGAEGVIIGTRLLATREAPIHENLKQALVQANELDTMLIMRSIGSTHRVWNNSAAKKCLKLETAQATQSEILKIVAGENTKKMYDTGKLDAGTMSCGQGVGIIHDIPTVKELIDRIITEAAKIAEKLP